MGARGDTPLKLGDVFDRPEWQYRSRCYQKNLDPNTFFPSKAQRPVVIRRQYREIKEQHCIKCPTQQECLQYALDNNITDGMFGGLTPRERRMLKRANTGLVTPNIEVGKHPVHQGRDSNGQFVSMGTKMSADERRRRQRERDRKRLASQRESKNLP